ncbi:MAG: HD domain-containing protein [Agathobacter sp.]|nr:HD domain-containing protein [Agathobacter sp.]
MEFIKLQICCLIIALYIAFVYVREIRLSKKKHKLTVFDIVLVISLITLAFDAGTAYTINHMDTVPAWLNDFTHVIFLVGLASVIFGAFFYIVAITEGLPKTKIKKFIYHFPYLVGIIVIITNINSLEYLEGEASYYSMGIPVYACFVLVTIYILIAQIVFFRSWNYIERRKRANILLYMLVLVGITGYQMNDEDSLITSAGILALLIGMYINHENPAIKELSHYHKEMVMGFATLVEQRDDSTGGHIRRTSAYAQCLAQELRKHKYYKNILTKDYIRNLSMAAPMHDIGKIAVPDAILQKPGKLTDEEFDIMKTHTTSGGEIIKDTFGHLSDADYMNMAYDVAMYHHEKWNGKGYPSGLAGEDIPLCARIMAVADVFDAVSEKRCYRDAMPLEKCFQIIEEGKGRDFDPVIVDTFLGIKELIIYIHKNPSSKEVEYLLKR